MVDQNILNEIRKDFYLGPDHEMLIIQNDEIDAFWDWFAGNSNHYTVTESKNQF